jgi:FMN phosphatase YigB (HAD superfamily)
MPRTDTPIRGVIFDLDGTLYRMPWFMKPVLFAMLLPHGLRLSTYMRVRKRMAGQDFGSGAALMGEMSERLGRSAGLSAEAARAWIVGPFYTAFVNLMPLMRDSRPGLAGALAALRGAGIRRGVLSDFNRVRGRLEALGLPLDLFDTVDSSEEFGALKPSTRPFVHIAQRWGLAAEQVLVVGDRDDTDGAAARAAGMHFVRVSDSVVGGQGMRWPQLRGCLEHMGDEH